MARQSRECHKQSQRVMCRCDRHAFLGRRAIVTWACWITSAADDRGAIQERMGLLGIIKVTGTIPRISRLTLDHIQETLSDLEMSEKDLNAWIAEQQRRLDEAETNSAREG